MGEKDTQVGLLKGRGNRKIKVKRGERESKGRGEEGPTRGKKSELELSTG